MLDKLPNELLHNIISNISYQELNMLRQISKKLRKFCDSPIYWKRIAFESRENKFLQLSTLKSIVGPHSSHVESIELERVRDSTLHYLLTDCINLQHLTIRGWVTLSSHSLRSSTQKNLALKRLLLFSSPNKPNYISVDSYTLGQLMIQSLNLTHVLLLCQAHIHAEQLISLLEKTNKEFPLVIFTIPFNKSWNKNHILRLSKMCPNIQRICLMLETENTGVSSESRFEEWLHEKTGSLPSNTSIVTANDCIIYTHQA